MPQQLHLAISAQFYTQLEHVGVKNKHNSQTLNTLHTTLIPFITHITNVLQ